MKTLFTFLAIIATSTFCLAQNPERSDNNLGLVYHLVEVKSKAENRMREIITGSVSMKKSGKQKTPKRPATKAKSDDYIELKMRVDQFIIQLTADLKRNNGLKLYKKIDNYYKDVNVKKIDNDEYSKLLVLIDGKYKNFIAVGDTLQADFKLGEFSPADILGGISDIIISARDFRAKKIDDLTKLMDGLRLSSIADLIGKKKEEN